MESFFEGREEQVLRLGTRCCSFVEGAVARRNRESERARRPGGRGRWHCGSEVLRRIFPRRCAQLPRPQVEMVF